MARASYIAVGAVALLSGCTPAPDAALLANATENGAVVPEPTPAPSAVPAPRPAGFTNDETREIQQAIRNRFVARKYASGMGALYATEDCNAVFTVGNPIIADAMLGEGTGKLKVIIPITAHTVPPKWRSVPTDRCYDFTVPQVTLGNTMRVPYEFTVERWQTGWRLAQVPPGTPFQLAPR